MSSVLKMFEVRMLSNANANFDMSLVNSSSNISFISWVI